MLPGLPEPKPRREDRRTKRYAAAPLDAIPMTRFGTVSDLSRVAMPETPPRVAGLPYCALAYPADRLRSAVPVLVALYAAISAWYPSCQR